MPSASVPTTAETPSGKTRCYNPDGFSVSYPSDWFTNAGDVVPACSQFSPEQFQVPQTDDRVAPITAFVDAVEFFRAAPPQAETATELSRAATVIDGRQAVRVEQESTEQGIFGPGVLQTRYIVDLAIGTDDTVPGTLFVDAVDLSGFDYSYSVRILDEMARSLSITAGDSPDLPGVISRYEGGGGGFSVVADAADAHVCLRIPPEGEPSCVDYSAADAVHTTELPLVGPEDVLAGVAGDEVFRIDAYQADGDVISVLPAPISGTDSKGFAFSGGAAQITELRWFDVGGEEIGRRASV